MGDACAKVGAGHARRNHRDLVPAAKSSWMSFLQRNRPGETAVFTPSAKAPWRKLLRRNRRARHVCTWAEACRALAASKVVHFLNRKVSAANASCIIFVNTRYSCNGDNRRDDHVGNTSRANDDNGDDDGDGAAHEIDVPKEI